MTRTDSAFRHFHDQLANAQGAAPDDVGPRRRAGRPGGRRAAQAATRIGPKPSLPATASSTPWRSRSRASPSSYLRCSSPWRVISASSSARSRSRAIWSASATTRSTSRSAPSASSRSGPRSRPSPRSRTWPAGRAACWATRWMPSSAADGTLGREVCKADDAVDALLNSALPHPPDAHDGGCPQHHAVPGADPRRAQPGAGRRPRDEHRRRRGLPGRGKADQAPLRRPARADRRRAARRGDRSGDGYPGSPDARGAGTDDAVAASAPRPATRVGRRRHRRGWRALRQSRAAVRVAAIDIGSNSIRQIVADVSHNGIDPRRRRAQGAAPAWHGRRRDRRSWRAEPMRRALEALIRMATLARQLGAKRIEAVATSAVRDATNGRAFMDRGRERDGTEGPARWTARTRRGSPFGARSRTSISASAAGS